MQFLYTCFRLQGVFLPMEAKDSELNFITAFVESHTHTYNPTNRHTRYTHTYTSPLIIDTKELHSYFHKTEKPNFRVAFGPQAQWYCI